MHTQDSEVTLNPYLMRTPVRDNSKFINRGAELREIYTYLNLMQSVWIIGETGSGKSSLLYRLTTEEVSAPYKCYFLDMQRVLSSTEFYREILKELQQYYKTTDSQDPRNDCLETLSNKQQVILCLDNFDTAIGNINFNEGFFGTLTSLIESGQLALVVTSEFTPTELHESTDVVSHSFYKPFSALHLRELDDYEALEFIKQPASKVGKPFASYEERVILSFLQNKSRLYPYHINVACAIAFQEKLNGRSISEDTLQKLFVRKLNILQEESATEALFIVDTQSSSEPLPIPKVEPIPLSIWKLSKWVLRKHQPPIFTVQERIPITVSLVILGTAILFFSSKSNNITGVYIAILLLAIALLLQIYFTALNRQSDESSMGE